MNRNRNLIPLLLAVLLAAAPAQGARGKRGTAVEDGPKVDAGELALMLEGIDLRGSNRRRRWRQLPHERDEKRPRPR